MFNSSISNQFEKGIPLSDTRLDREQHSSGIAQKVSKIFKRLLEKILRWAIVATAKLTSLSLTKETFYREKKGVEIHAYFPDHSDLVHLKKFDVIPLVTFDEGPLTAMQMEETQARVRVARQILEAPQQYSPTEVEEAKAYLSFFKRSSEYKATRNDYTLADWNLLDQVSFGIIERHFMNLCSLFNSDCLNQIQADMEKEFGVNYKEALIGEVLAKSLAYLANLDGKKIGLPARQEDGSFAIENFKIQLQPLGDALPCYILEHIDQKASPWVVPRGTEPHFKEEKGQPLRPAAFESVLADAIDPFGIAEAVVIKALVKEANQDGHGRETLTQFFYRQQGSHVHLAGHSLGGYLVNDLALRFPHKIKTAYGFSAPAVNPRLGQEWGELVRDGKLKKEQIVNFDIEGDGVAGVGLGDGLIGKRIAIAPMEQVVQDPIHCHLKHDLSTPFRAQEVDVVKEQKKLSRHHVNRLRAFGGKLLKLFMAVQATIGEDPRPDWWMNRKEYLKRFNELKIQP